MVEIEKTMRVYSVDVEGDKFQYLLLTDDFDAQAEIVYDCTPRKDTWKNTCKRHGQFIASVGVVFVPRVVEPVELRSQVSLRIF